MEQGQITHQAKLSYYAAALRCLAFVEQRRPTRRRFDAEADAKWAAFRGGLARADRIDLLIRDADAEWPGAFGARRVFALGGGSEDEPFGSGWEPLDPSDAEQIWSEVEAERASDDPQELLSRVARAWGAELWSADLEDITPQTRLCLVGGGAVAAAAGLFCGQKQLDWATQVTVVAESPAHRQIACLAAAILDVRGKTALWDELLGQGRDEILRGARLVISSDATKEERALIEDAKGRMS